MRRCIAPSTRSTPTRTPCAWLTKPVSMVCLDQHPHWAADVPLSVNAPPADYARFVQKVAARYRGRVLGYIIWNEPNLASDWGGRRPDPVEYVALLKTAYQAVKAADPKALVVSAGLASTNHQDDDALDDRTYLEAMYEAGAAPYFDVLGAHPYGFAYPRTTRTARTMG